VNFSTINSDVDRPFRRYTRFLLFCLFGGLAVSGILTYSVDPYGVFGNNTLGIYISAEREAKTMMVHEYPHDVLLLGNSKSALVAVGGVKEAKVFNGGIAGASMAEILLYAERFARPQELVILGVDLGQDGSVGQVEEDPFRPLNVKRKAGYIFSLKSVEYTFKTLGKSWSGAPPSLKVNGAQHPERWYREYRESNPPLLAYRVEQFVEGWIEQISIEPEAFDAYKRLKEMLADRGIDLRVCVYPMHPDITSKFTEEHRMHLSQWRFEMQLIFPRMQDFSRGEYSSYEHFTATDPVHFLPETGTRMLSKILSTEED